MIKRTLYAKIDQQMSSDNVIVITGMRRVGKTTLVRSLYDQIQDGRKVFLDLENPINQDYFQARDYDRIYSMFEREAIGTGKRMYVVLDEIQTVHNAPSVIKYLHDNYGIKFIVTGSASFYLKNLFSESLAGRKRIYELYPLDLKEYIAYRQSSFKPFALTDNIDPVTYEKYQKYTMNYIDYGGFPKVVLQGSSDEKHAELKDIITSYFQNEVQALSDFRKMAIVSSSLVLLASRTGSKLDVTKISNELGISRITLNEYLDFFEGTYFIHRIKPYSTSPDVRTRSRAKPYIADCGILQSMTQVSKGAVFENMVFNLIYSKGSVYYYQSKSGAEVDFVVEKEGKLTLFEVKIHPHNTDLTRLRAVSEKLGAKEYYLVSYNYVDMPHIVYPFQL